MTNHANFNTSTFSGGYGWQVGYKKGSGYDNFYWYRIANDAAYSKEYMVLNANGNLGINTSSPSQKLHVNGNIKVENSIIFSDGTSISSAPSFKPSGGGGSGVSQPLLPFFPGFSSGFGNSNRYNIR